MIPGYDVIATAERHARLLARVSYVNRKLYAMVAMGQVSKELAREMTMTKITIVLEVRSIYLTKLMEYQHIW
jgi:hypothetical protein